MKSSNIVLFWTRDDVHYRKKIDRNAFYAIMNSLKNGFGDDNEVSSLFCEIIPVIKSISINYDRNADLDIPFVVLGFEDETTKSVQIRRRHKIIWSIFDRYCKKEKD